MGYLKRSGKVKTKTLRFDTTFLTELEDEAKQQGLSTNALTERVIEQYINHGRWVIRRGGLTILPHTMQRIMDKLEDETILELGSELGSTIPKEGFYMRGMNDSRESARILVEEILGGYDNWFTVSYHVHSRPYFFLQSGLSEKWMLFVEAYLRALFKLFNSGVEIDREGTNIQILL